MGTHPVGGLRDSIAFGVSDDGNTIVGYYFDTSTGGNKSFLWSPAQGMRDLKTVLTTDLALNLSGWTLTVAFDVSADGNRIVGHGVNPNGQAEGWIARLCCSGDIDSTTGDGVVNIEDLLTVVANWGTSGTLSDINVNGTVGIDDLLAVVAAWGPCP